MKITLIQWSASLFVALTFNGSADDAEADATQTGARAQLERFSEGLETYHAAFEQRVVDTDGQIQESSDGELWLSRPLLFRWEYGGEFPEIIVADGKRVWIHDVMLEQVTVKEQSRLAVDSPLVLLTDIGKLDEQFEVREVGDTGDLALLELRSRREDAEFERVLLGLADNELRMMTMEDAFGLRTEIRFGSTERNPQLNRSLFAFELPEGVDVVGDLEEVD